MNFAKRVFLIAGVYGIIVISPQYFLESRIGRDMPPPITHPEYFYGFIGVTLAWQVVFLTISRDPVRYRPLMLAGILEKSVFGPAVVLLYAAGRVSMQIVAFGILDMVLGVLFLISYRRTPAAAPRQS